MIVFFQEKMLLNQLVLTGMLKKTSVYCEEIVEHPQNRQHHLPFLPQNSDKQTTQVCPIIIKEAFLMKLKALATAKT
jgi:hypothetical protein